jgi:hypothetical protein
MEQIKHATNAIKEQHFKGYPEKENRPWWITCIKAELFQIPMLIRHQVNA